MTPAQKGREIRNVQFANLVERVVDEVSLLPGSLISGMEMVQGLVKPLSVSCCGDVMAMAEQIPPPFSH